MLAFINRFRALEQTNPTLREIAYHFGWNSCNAAHIHVSALERKGVVVRRPSGRYLVVAAHAGQQDTGALVHCMTALARPLSAGEAAR